MNDALGNVTTNAYDANGNLTSITSPQPNGNSAENVTHFTYDPKGELTQIIDPLSNPTTLTYTSAGLIATITDAQQHTTTYQYDTRGNRTAVIDPINGASHPTTFTYDSMSRSDRHHLSRRQLGRLRVRLPWAADFGDRSEPENHDVHLRRRRPADLRDRPGEQQHAIQHMTVRTT